MDNLFRGAQIYKDKLDGNNYLYVYQKFNNTYDYIEIAFIY